MRPASAARSAALALTVIACATGWLAPLAKAEFGAVQLISKSTKEQAELGKEPALSGDGRFVAFVGKIGGHAGIFRKDLATGALTLVAERHLFEEVLEAPSISAEGRYVAFTTTQTLEPAADLEAETEDVYVADVATSPPTYQLASGTAVEGHERRLGGRSTAAGRVALSADGEEVAFVNDGQVYVRDLDDPEPTLISGRRDGVTGATGEEPVSGGAAFQKSGAALSADGNAIAWVGEHLPEQVPLLPDEEERIRTRTYREPLWRLVPTELDNDPPTRRILGGGDPTAPGCPAGGTLALLSCQGPFPRLDEDHLWRRYVEGENDVGWGNGLPQLSADGETVAVIGSPEEVPDLFVVDMSTGVTRAEALQQITKWTNPDPAAREPQTSAGEPQNQPYTGEVIECALSPSGDEVAFTTERQRFLTGPILATPVPTAPAVMPELYQANLGLGTIERVTPGPGTGVSTAATLGGGAASPSYSADGDLLVFADTAYNLVGGDANEASDIFLVESKPPAPIEPSKISPRPSSISVVPVRRLSAHAVSRPDGAVRVIATVPTAGTLKVSATSPLGPRLHSRVVDSARRQVAAGGALRIELKLPRPLQKLAHRRGGLYTWLELHFASSTGAPLQQQFAARFRAHRIKPSKKGKGR